MINYNGFSELAKNNSDILFNEFQEICKPIIEWLNKNYHPYVSIMVTPTGAQINEQFMSFPSEEYIKD